MANKTIPALSNTWTPSNVPGNAYIEAGSATQPVGLGSARMLLEYLKPGFISVIALGADPTGVSDSTTAINNAIAMAGNYGCVFFPVGIYLISSKLTQLEGQRWVGEGGQRSATLKKGFNGTAVDVATLGEIIGLNGDGNGGTYTGKFFNVPAGYSQKIVRVRVVDSVGECLFFASAVGAGCVVESFEGVTTSPLTVAAIGIAGDASTATPRFFNNVWLAGGFADFSSCNDLFIANAYLHHIKTDANSAQLYAVNIRYASSGAAITIKGTDSKYTNCAFAGAVAFENCQGVAAIACDFGFGFTEDSATCQYNQIWDQTKDFAMTWGNVSGTQPAIGDGTIECKYVRKGRECFVYFRIVMGSTTTFGNAGSAYYFTLPFKGDLSFNQRAFYLELIDVSAPLVYPASGVLAANDNAFTIQCPSTQGARSDHPFTFAAGDVIQGHFSYLVR